IVEVDERHEATTVADDGELPLPHRLDEPVVRGAVEAAVAQRDAARVDDGVIEVVRCRPALDRAGDRLGVGGILLGLDHAAPPGVPEGDAALRDESAYAC